MARFFAITSSDFCPTAKFKKTYMAFNTNSLMLHIKRLVYASVRLGYHYACDYPIVFGAGILLLLLQRLCPSLFNFLLSSSPVFMLTALLLGALLSYGEPAIPVIGDTQQILSLKSNISITDCSIDKVETAAVEEHLENTTGSNEDDDMQDTQCEEKNGTYVPVDNVLSDEVYIKDGTSDYNLYDTHCEEKEVRSMGAANVPFVEPSGFAKSTVTVETEDHIVENSKSVELQEFRSINPESGNNKVQNQYQLGEFMSSCWQPVMRQDTFSDSESDLTDSSPDASMTDIIPMLEELHPLIDLQTDHPSLASRDNLNTSSDDDGDDLDEDDVSSDENGSEEKKDCGKNWKDVIDLNSLDMENNSKLDSVMDLQRAKNILKFELDKRLMDLQSTDAVQKMEAASRFCVQIPSISTTRQNPFYSSNGSEEIIELPRLPDSAPSSLHPRRNLFDLFDQNVDHGSQLQETWTPQSYFAARQHKKHANLYQWHSPKGHHNRLKLEKDEISENVAYDSQLKSYVKQEGNNGKLFGSLETHMSEEIKIVCAAISDVGVLEVNHETDDVNKNADLSDVIISSPSQQSIQNTSETKVSVYADNEHSILYSMSKVSNCEGDIVEADTIGEVNSLFKCRMEEVLVQSISESTIGQPFTVNPEDDLSHLLSSDSGMHAIDASSVEELNSQFAQLNDESMPSTTAYSTCHCELIQQNLTEALPPGNVHNSEPENEDRSRELLKTGDQQSTDISGLQIIETRSIDDINSFIKQHCEEPNKNALKPSLQNIQKSNDEISSGSEQTRSFSELHVLEVASVEDIAAELHSSSYTLHVAEAGSVEE